MAGLTGQCRLTCEGYLGVCHWEGSWRRPPRSSPHVCKASLPAGKEAVTGSQHSPPGGVLLGVWLKGQKRIHSTQWEGASVQ